MYVYNFQTDTRCVGFMWAVFEPRTAYGRDPEEGTRTGDEAKWRVGKDCLTHAARCTSLSSSLIFLCVSFSLAPSRRPKRGVPPPPCYSIIPAPTTRTHTHHITGAVTDPRKPPIKYAHVKRLRVASGFLTPRPVGIVPPRRRNLRTCVVRPVYETRLCALGVRDERKGEKK